MIRNAQALVYLAFYLAILVLAVIALVDAGRRPAPAFPAAGKRTKGFWVLVLVVATAVAFVAIPWPVGIGQLSFLALGSAVVSIVYLVDVKPVVSGPGGPRGPRGPARGGW